MRSIQLLLLLCALLGCRATGGDDSTPTPAPADDDTADDDAADDDAADDDSSPVFEGLWGYVVALEGKPRPGATLTDRATGTARQTNENGRIELPVTAGAPLVIDVAADGQMATFLLPSDPPGGREYSFLTAAQLAAIYAEVQVPYSGATSTLLVVLVNPDGVFRSGVQVSLAATYGAALAPGGDAPEPGTTTRDDGTVAFLGAAAGDTTLTLSDPSCGGGAFTVPAGYTLAMLRCG